MTKKQVYTLPAQHWLTVHWLKQTELVQRIVQEYVLDLPDMSLCPWLRCVCLTLLQLTGTQRTPQNPLRYPLEIIKASPPDPDKDIFLFAFAYKILSPTVLMVLHPEITPNRLEDPIGYQTQINCMQCKCLPAPPTKTEFTKTSILCSPNLVLPYRHVEVWACK